MAPRRLVCSRIGRAGSTLALIAAFAWISPRAEAQPAASEADIAAARALGVDGIALADRGECAPAIEKLERAAKLYSAPTILVPLGECHVKLGHLVVGAEILQRVAREALAANAPRPFVLAQGRARTILEQATPRIAKLRIDVVAPTGVAFTVTDNDIAVRDVLIGSDKPADPGHHVVVASARGYLPAKQEVDVAEGGATAVTLTLEIDPNGPPPETPAVKPTSDAEGDENSDPPEEDAETSTLVPVGIVALSIGGAGLITWGVTGALGLSTASDLDGTCKDGKCPPSSQGQIDDLDTLGLVSTIGLVVGAVGVGVGVTLLVVDASSGEESAGAGASRTVVKAGPGSIAVAGSF